jgi:hypothetical protein
MNNFLLLIQKKQQVSPLRRVADEASKNKKQRLKTKMKDKIKIKD